MKVSLWGTRGSLARPTVTTGVGTAKMTAAPTKRL